MMLYNASDGEAVGMAGVYQPRGAVSTGLRL